MATYTAFCQDADGTGTIWIDEVQADHLPAAIEQARAECAADWGCEPDQIHVLGIAEGNVRIAHWEDAPADDASELPELTLDNMGRELPEQEV